MTRPKYRQSVGKHEERLPGDAIVNEFLGYVRAGNSINVASGLVGWNSGTVSKWQKEGDGPPEKARKWAIKFAKDVREAKAFALGANLQIIQKAAALGDWKAAAWFMERAEPEVWGRQARIDVNVGGQVEVVSARDRLNEVLDVLSWEMEESDVPELEGAAGEVEPADEGSSPRSAQRRTA